MKKLLALLTLFTTTIASACWFQYYNYQDYIFGINNFECHSEVSFVNEDGKETTRYIAKNNMVVDFPISVSMKLTSHSIILGETRPEIKQAILQYRVLPDGDWVTVSEYETSFGTIPTDAKPAFYLGRNNINPRGCKKDDVIMIRLYITDGIWQSGILEDKCSDKLGQYDHNKRSDLYTLMDKYDYTLKDPQLNNYDLGGNWLPHLVTTVIFSGNYRPVR